jgi:hypothetical protein
VARASSKSIRGGARARAGQGDLLADDRRDVGVERHHEGLDLPALGDIAQQPRAPAPDRQGG